MRTSNGLLMIGLGATLMYFFDPQAGRRRRALARDRYVHTMRKLEDARRVVVRDATQRKNGLVAQASRLVSRRDRHPDDTILIERVRSALGRVVSHPAAIEVNAGGGAVRLGGAILASEVDALVDCVRAVRGVGSVENQLSVFDDPGNIPSLQGGAERSGERIEFLQQNWSPAARATAGAFGGGLAMYGLFRGGIGGLALGAVGAGLLARAAANRDLKSLVGAGADCEGIRIHKTINIAAPAERGRLILAEQQRVLLGADSTMSSAQRDSALAHAARLTDSLAAVPGWMQWFVRYDPLPAARRVHTPVLILQGETDRQVPAAQATTLAEAMRAAGNQRVTLRIFPRMNHLMLDDPSGDPRGYASLPTKTVRRDMLGALADWLAQML